MDSHSFRGHGYTYRTRLWKQILSSIPNIEPPIAEPTLSGSNGLPSPGRHWEHLADCCEPRCGALSGRLAVPNTNGSSWCLILIDGPVNGQSHKYAANRI